MTITITTSGSVLTIDYGYKKYIMPLNKIKGYHAEGTKLHLMLDSDVTFFKDEPNEGVITLEFNENTIVYNTVTFTSAFTLLTSISTATVSATTIASWGMVIGNSIAISYFAGVAARNPSGTTTNIDTIAYKTGGVTKISQEFTYNAVDDITLIEAK